MMLIKLAWRNIWRNKKRSIITITAIVIAVFLAVVMRSLQLGMYDNMIQNIVGSYSGHIQIHSIGYWEEQTIDNAFEYIKRRSDSRPFIISDMGDNPTAGGAGEHYSVATLSPHCRPSRGHKPW